MTLGPQHLDTQQTKLEQAFTGLAQLHPKKLAQQYLQLHGNKLSIRLAAELSENFKHSNLTRGYYRDAVAPGAQLILNQVWKFILEHRSENKPLLVIAGGGPGSGKFTAITRPLLALTKETIAIYDVSNQTTTSIQQLINHCHTQRVPTIFAYIVRPLPNAARAAIERDLNEGVTPNPEIFAAAHYENYNDFLSLTAYYRKAKKVFAPIVITNTGPPDLTQVTKQSYLEQFAFTIAEAEEIFTAVLDEKLNQLPSRFPEPQAVSLRPARKPRCAKTLTGQSTLIGYLLGQSLRTALITNEQIPTTHGRFRVLKDSSTGPQPPTQTLVQIDTAVLQSSVPTDKHLDNERPTRIVVRETPSRCHEMETAIVR
jgi:hypothetical protein